jgi:hypothetical protein
MFTIHLLRMLQCPVLKALGEPSLCKTIDGSNTFPPHIDDRLVTLLPSVLPNNQHVLLFLTTDRPTDFHCGSDAGYGPRIELGNLEDQQRA